MTLATIRSDLSIMLRDTSHNIWSAAEKLAALNFAIRNAYPSWYTETFADTLVVQEDKLEYDLPTMTRLIDVAVEQSGNYTNGVATGGSTSTLEDTNASWTTNEYAGWHVTLYYGTSAGQYALVASNTATALTLTTSGYNWTASPDTTSKYCIKDYATQDFAFRPIWGYKVNKTKSPTKLYLAAPYTPGMYLRLHYVTAPAELSDDADTTIVPDEWLVLQAAARLHLMRMENAPGHHVDVDQGLFQYYQTLADNFKANHSFRFPPTQIRIESEAGGFAYPDDYPF